MGGRFGKYGDAKRKALIRKNRFRPPVSPQRKRDKPQRGAGKGKVQRRVRRSSSFCHSTPAFRPSWHIRSLNATSGQKLK